MNRITIVRCLESRGSLRVSMFGCQRDEFEPLFGSQLRQQPSLRLGRHPQVRLRRGLHRGVPAGEVGAGVREKWPWTSTVSRFKGRRE